MTDNVTPLGIVWTGEGFRMGAEKVLTGAIEADLHDVVICGRTADEKLYVASNVGCGETLLLIHQSSHDIIAKSLED